MGFQRLCTAGAAAAIALTVLVGAAAPASASAVGDNVRAEKRVAREIRDLTKHGPTHARKLHRAVVIAQRDSDARPGLRTQSVLRLARRAELRFNSWATRRLGSLKRRRSDLQAWLYSWGIFRACPVDAPRYIHNDFGEIVHVEGVEPHVHMGSDIEAPSWTPIRAPFDGYAWGSYSPLGGYQVRVRGDRGYVFNAHLIAYGDLGWARARSSATSAPRGTRPHLTIISSGIPGTVARSTRTTCSPSPATDLRRRFPRQRPFREKCW